VAGIRRKKFDLMIEINNSTQITEIRQAKEKAEREQRD